MGSVAPSVSLAYLAERYEHGAEAGDANALVSHLVLRVLMAMEKRGFREGPEGT